MLSYYKGSIPIINDDPQSLSLAFPARDGDGHSIGRGYVPRDYSVYPEAMFDSPSQMQLIPESEWDARYDEQEAQQSSLEHIFLSGPGGQPRFVNLDQNGHGYCWAYSTGHSIMIKRLAMNLPLVRLNPHAAAAIIKRGADEGGWCGLSGQFARENGYAEEGTGPGQWPLHSRNLQYDTPALRASMAKYKIVENWVDLTRQVYDQNLTQQQLATQLFLNNPCPVDFNWQSHSLCAIRKVRVERGSWGTLILNSWKGWGRFGLAVYQGSKGIPDGAICTRTVAA